MLQLSIQSHGCCPSLDVVRVLLSDIHRRLRRRRHLQHLRLTKLSITRQSQLSRPLMPLLRPLPRPLEVRAKRKLRNRGLPSRQKMLSAKF